MEFAVEIRNNCSGHETGQHIDSTSLVQAGQKDEDQEIAVVPGTTKTFDSDIGGHMKCINCNNEFPDNVNNGVQDNKLCSKCFQTIKAQYRSADNQNSVSRQKTVNKSVIIIKGISSFILIVCILRIWNSCNNTPSQITATWDNTIFNAQEIVKKSLKAPSTAKFSEGRVIDHIQHGDTVWFIIFTAVDAQNEYGARLKAYYLISLFTTSDEKFHWHGDAAISEIDMDPTEMAGNGLIYIDALKCTTSYPDTSLPCYHNNLRQKH